MTVREDIERVAAAICREMFVPDDAEKVQSEIAGLMAARAAIRETLEAVREPDDEITRLRLVEMSKVSGLSQFQRDVCARAAAKMLRLDQLLKELDEGK